MQYYDPRLDELRPMTLRDGEFTRITGRLGVCVGWHPVARWPRPQRPVLRWRHSLRRTRVPFFESSLYLTVALFGRRVGLSIWWQHAS